MLTRNWGGAVRIQEDWCRYAYFRHAPENNWYPHYIHNLDNLIRFGGLYPPIHVNADIRRTVLLGATWVYEVVAWRYEHVTRSSE